jgi:hypothetical protein
LRLLEFGPSISPRDSSRRALLLLLITEVVNEILNVRPQAWAWN